MRETIRRALADGEIPSLAVAVVRGGEIVWEEAFGQLTPHRPATIHTPYSLASVSKPFTATAVMALVEWGDMELDRPVDAYLDGPISWVGVGDPRQATIRRLANHTAGLPLHHRFFTAERAPPPMREIRRRFGILAIPPGDRFRYSNLGYGILGEAVATARGMSFAEAMAAEVFRPLGLEHTAVVVRPEDLPGRAPRSDSDGTALPFYTTDHPGASAVWACVHDLARFALFHLGVGDSEATMILHSRSLNRMTEPGARRPDTGHGYGIGWTVARRGHQRVVFHTGGMPGTTATLSLMPRFGHAVAVVANARSEIPLHVSREIWRRLAPIRPDAEPLASPSGLESPALDRGRRRAPRRWRREWHGTLRFEDDSTAPLELLIEGDGQRTVIGDREVDVLTARFRGRSLRLLARGRLKASGEGERTLLLDLDRRGGRATGVLTEFSEDPVGLPAALSYWVELRAAPRP